MESTSDAPSRARSLGQACPGHNSGRWALTSYEVAPTPFWAHYLSCHHNAYWPYRILSNARRSTLNRRLISNAGEQTGSGHQHPQLLSALRVSGIRLG